MLNKSITENGCLTGINISSLNFIPKRLFIVDSVPAGAVRGNHAHLKDYQILYCLSGELHIETINKKNITNYITLKIGDNIDIPPLTWCIIRFVQNNSSFICICSENYDEKEYIRNYNDFQNIITNHDNLSSSRSGRSYNM
jgi:dTDP-4-dehydrorhamnose 3,5-epimerase-like enzyme